MGLFDFFKKDKKKTVATSTTDPNTCPNCWGYQAYEGKVKDVEFDHQKDVNNKQTKDAFVKAIQVRYVDGIQDKKDAKHCKKCNRYYTIDA